MSLLVILGGSKALVPPGSASVHLRIEATQVLAVVACVRPLALRLEVRKLTKPLLHRPLLSSCGQAPSYRLTTPGMILSDTRAPTTTAPRSLDSSTRSPSRMPLALASCTLMVSGSRVWMV